MARTRRIAQIGVNCVACGVCQGACPIKAVSIHKGIRANVDPNTCVGCGKCEKACPAGIIAIQERREDA